MDHSTQQNSAIQTALADFVVATRYEQLPDELVTRLKWSLLDSLGCGMQGSETEWGQIIAKLSAAYGSGESRIWGKAQNKRVGPLAAVLANGTMIQSFELDDVHYGSRSHPGSVTVPVAVALIESGLPLDGRRVLESLAVGYEVLARVGACQGVSSFNRGWHPTGTAGAFAAAATAARLLGLDAAQTVHALGIAGTMPAGLMAAQFGAMVKRLYAGHAAWAGLTAALLARDGFTGIPDIFDVGFGGYPKAISDEINLGALTDALGVRYEAAAIGYKLYSCVGTNHTMLGAIEEILHRGPLDWRDVETVRITTSEYQVLHSGWPYKPSTVMAAQMNMGYCVAVRLIQGAVFVEQFQERFLADPDILALAGRVVVETDHAQDHKDRTAKVEIVLRDGRKLAATCSAARGHPSNPPDAGDIERKFMRLTEKIIPASNGERVVQIVFGLQNFADLSELPALLVADAGPSQRRNDGDPSHQRHTEEIQ